MAGDGRDVEEPRLGCRLECACCNRISDATARGWRAYLTWEEEERSGCRGARRRTAVLLVCPRCFTHGYADR